MFLDFADVLVKLTRLRFFREVPAKVESHLETRGSKDMKTWGILLSLFDLVTSSETQGLLAGTMQYL